MALNQQDINVGAAPNDGEGDPIRSAFIKCNDNFTQLYSLPNPTPPVSLIGATGDMPGMYAYDDTYFYYCYLPYDGVTTVWGKLVQSDEAIPSIGNGQSNVSIAFANANITVGVAGTSNVAVFSPTGLTIAGNVVANNLAVNTFTANSFVANTVIGNNISVQSVTSGNITIAGDNINSVWNTITIQPTTPGQVVIGGNAVIQGNVKLSNSLYVGTNYIVVGNSFGDPSTANLSGLYVGSIANAYAYFIYKNTNDEWYTQQNINTSGNVSGNILRFATANIVDAVTANSYSGNAFLLNSINGSNVVGAVGNADSSVTANYAAYAGNVINSAQPNITSVGNLISLFSTGNVQGNVVRATTFVYAPSLFANANVVANSGLYAPNIGFDANTLLQGTLGVLSNSQPNITSVGNLTSLNLDGPLVSNGNAYFAGDVFAGNINANVTGYIASAQFVTANAQPNITSVGNLSFLRVNGNAYASTMYAPIMGGAPGYGNTVLYGQIGGLSNAQPNITSVGNLVSVQVNGTSNLGNIIITGNVIAAGGTNDIYLDPQIDGSPGTGTVHVLGNLDVQGTTTTINSNVVAINDLVFVVANNATTSSQADGGGIAVGPDPSHYAELTWSDATSSWLSSVPLIVTGGVTASNFNWANGSPLIASNGAASFSTIDTTGNVAVGGNVSAQYFIGTATQAQYADLAECYLADATYEPGTVLKFGGPQEVTVSSSDMDTLVAGVVSTQPAHLMNSELVGDHVIALALTGRVPCKVTGTVTPGAMMVSNGDGTARAELQPAIGSVIGKAVQGFNGDQGTIEIVVGRL